MKLSIIIPTYNEQNTLSHVVDRIQSVAFPIDYEIIVIDDASSNNAGLEPLIERARERNGKTEIHLIRNEINKGKGFSVRRGIDQATGDLVIIQDADREYDPHDIPKLLGPILKGQVDVVYGSRFAKVLYPRRMALLSWAANRFLTLFTNLLFRTRLTDMETCYKVCRTDVLRSLDLRSNRFAIEPEITALLAKRRIIIQELPISYEGRSAEEGKKIKARDFFSAVATLLYYRFIHS